MVAQKERAKDTNDMEQPAAIQALQHAGLDTGKLRQDERAFLAKAFTEKVAELKKSGEPFHLEYETGKWLLGQLEMKRNSLAGTGAPAEQLRGVDDDIKRVNANMGRIYDRITKLLATKTEVPQTKLLPREETALRGMGVNPADATAEERREASRRSAYSSPFVAEDIRAMPNVVGQIMSKYGGAIGKQNETFTDNAKTPEKFVEEAIALASKSPVNLGTVNKSYERAVHDYANFLKMYAMNGKLGSEPQERIFAGLSSEERTINIAMAQRNQKQMLAVEAMPSFIADLRSDEAYTKILKDSKKSPEELMRDAIAMASGRKVDVGPPTSQYAIAVAGFANAIGERAEDPRLGRTRNERMLAGLSMMERDAAGATQAAGPMIAQKAAPAAKEAPLSDAGKWAVENGTWRAAIEDSNATFPETPKTGDTLIADAMKVAKTRKGEKVDLGPAGDMYAQAVNDLARELAKPARDAKLGRTPDQRMLAYVMERARGPAQVVAEREMAPETEEARTYNYRFTVAPLGGEEKPATYTFSSDRPIDSRLFNRALDTDSAQDAMQNMRALHITGMSEQAVAKLWDEARQPDAIVGLEEIKARKKARN